MLSFPGGPPEPCEPQLHSTIETFSGLEAIPAPYRGSVITIGNFDGIHRGHQRILEMVRAEADRCRVRSVLCTFRPHPQSVVGSRSGPLLLQSDRQQREILAGLGVDAIVYIPFDVARARQTPQQFYKVLQDSIAPTAVVVGGDFRFGEQKAGDVHLLTSLARSSGTNVLVVQRDAADPRSSSNIRALLEDGDIESAGRLLGRPFELEGTVEAIRASASSLEIDVASRDGLARPPTGYYFGGLRGPCTSSRSSASAWLNTLGKIAPGSTACDPTPTLRVRCFVDRLRTGDRHAIVTVTSETSTSISSPSIPLLGRTVDVIFYRAGWRPISLVPHDSQKGYRQ